MSPRLTPPGSHQGQAALPRRGPPWVVIGVFLLLLLVVFVVVVLPKLVSPPAETDPEVAVAPPSAPPAPVEVAVPGPPLDPPSSAVTQPVQSESLGESQRVEIEREPQSQFLANNGSDTNDAQHDGEPVLSPDSGGAAPISGSSAAQATAPAPDNSLEEERKTAFAAAMSRALGALESGDLRRAGGALSEAETLIPGTSAVKEGRRQVAAISKSRRLKHLAASATRSEAQEAWEEAVRYYDQILELAPSSTIARVGRKRASDRLAMEQAADHYLQQPQRLQSAVPLANAKQLLQRFEAYAVSSPGLRAKGQRLKQLIIEAETPYAVTIRSDGATEVMIYPVGRLGRFNLREVSLTPGTYTAVGTREGFRDVRKVFVLRPGQQLEIIVRCEEAI